MKEKKKNQEELNNQKHPPKFSGLLFLALQLVVMLYTFASVFGKCAAGYPFLSFGFICFYGLEILILGIYAVLWQQIIKRMDLSIAYANRAMALFWSMLWAVLFFKESISLNNVIGILIVIVGTILVNGEANG